MSRGTDVLYNGVALRNVTTREFEQEFVLDPSGTDLIGTRVRMSFECYVHIQNLGTILHGAGATILPHPNLMLADVRRRLEQPRGVLVIDTNGTNLFTINPAITPALVAQTGTDVANGPHPRSLRITSVIPDKTFRIVYTIEFMTSNCLDGSPPNVVINNRWTVTEEMDPTFFRTRRIAGRIRFSSAGWAGHAYLPWVVPGLEDGFARQAITYETLESGLEATYSVVDTQTHVAAPWPATQISGDYSWSTNIESGTWLHHAECTLHGSPEADPKLLFAQAFRVIDQRINYLARAAPGGPINPNMLMDCVVSEHVGRENVVRAAFTIKMMAESGSITTLLGNIVRDQLAKPLALEPLQGVPYNILHSRIPSLYGTVPWGGARNPATLFLMHCYWQDPCSRVKSIYQNTQPGQYPGAAPGYPPQQDRYPQEIQGQQTQALPPGDLQYIDVQEAALGLYTLARISDEYTTDELIVQLPIANRQGGVPTGPTCVLLDLADGASKRTIRYEAERVDEWPRIPSPEDAYVDGTIKAKLAKWWVEAPGERTTVDGMKKIRSLTGVYVYYLDRPPTVQATIALGRLPIHTFTGTKLPLAQMALASIAPNAS
jgi:hypothetical protein